MPDANTFHATTPERILVVDDDPTIQQLHSILLERAGFSVVAVGDGDSALRAIEAERFDAVLLDSVMPGLSGLEVLTRMRDAGVRIPVVLVTGATETHDRVVGLDLGADDYIAKPVAGPELVARVRAVVRGRQFASGDPSGTEAEATRAEIRRVIDDAAFTPVFQPIVDLDRRTPVAFEALTRFDDGARPDLRFLAAAQVGLGTELELATLQASIDAAARLPDGAALHLNLGPELLHEPALGPLLWSCPRPLVVELTEHVPIDDYATATELLEGLGEDIRLAVDDAGAGYASMAHILALRPDEVKLDRDWVRSVDTDTARQALISGLVTFADRTGTTLIAEGVETESEAMTLGSLGVERAQGYHLGRPADATEWAVA